MRTKGRSRGPSDRTARAGEAATPWASDRTEEEGPYKPWPQQAGGLGIEFEPTLDDLAEARRSNYGGHFRTGWETTDKPRSNSEAAGHFNLFGGSVRMAQRLPAWGSGKAFRARVRKAVAKRISTCLASSTRKQYGVGERKFVAFCWLGCIDLAGFVADARAAKHSDDFTALSRITREAEALVLGFISWVGQCRRHEDGEGLLSPGSVRNYAYGAMNFLAEVALLDGMTKYGKIPKVLQRLAQEYRAEKSATPQRRLALVPELGRQIVLYAVAQNSEVALAYADVYQATLFWGFRISELLLTKEYSTFDPERQLVNGGITLFQRVAGTKDSEEPVDEDELDDPELPARLTSVRVRTGKKTKTMRARERRHYKVSDEHFDLLCPVRTFLRVLQRAKKAGRGPGDMAFYVDGHGELKAGEAPSRRRAPAPNLGDGELTKQYVFEPLGGGLKEKELKARKRVNRFRGEPLVGARVRKRLDAVADPEAVPVAPHLAALTGKWFRDKAPLPGDDPDALYQVDDVFGEDGTIFVKYHLGSGGEAEFTPHAQVMAWADWGVVPPVTPDADGKYAGVVTKIVHFENEEGNPDSLTTGVHVDYANGYGEDYTIAELEGIIDVGKPKGWRTSWGTGYRGFLFTALYLGPEGKGCYWTTDQGRQRVNPRRYSTHSGRIALTTVLFAATGDVFLAKGLGGWASWAVLSYQHDAADRYKGVSDIIVQSKITAPMAESYDD